MTSTRIPLLLTLLFALASTACDELNDVGSPGESANSENRTDSPGTSHGHSAEGDTSLPTLSPPTTQAPGNPTESTPPASSNTPSGSQNGTGSTPPSNNDTTPTTDTPPASAESSEPSDLPSDPFDMLTDEERLLYDLLMDYRQDNGLPVIPLSPSLTIVAQAHATDLELHAAEILVDGCNMHSWSHHGDWVGCCYPSNHSNMPCMHNKPREMTDYTASGYEISVFHSVGLTAAGALSSWQGSSGHNDVILNVGMWSQAWNAVGVGIDGRYGHVWFGRAEDPALNP